MSSGTWQPTLFKNSYIYSSLNYKNIPVVGYTGYYGIEPTANTFLMCNSNNDWVTVDKNTYVSSEQLTNTLANYTTIENLTQTLGNYPTKTELNTKLESYPTETELGTTLQDYVTSDSLNTKLESYPTETELSQTLANYPTETELGTTLQSYPTKTELSTTLQDYVTSDSLNTKLESYPTETELSTTLQSYVTSDSLNTKLESYPTKSELGTIIEGDFVTNTYFTTYSNNINLELSDINDDINAVNTLASSNFDSIKTIKSNYALKIDLSNYAEVTEFNNLINSVNGLQEGLTDVVTNINSSLADYITIEDAGDYVVTNTAFTLYKNDMNTQIETINNNITDLQGDVNTQSGEISALQTTVGTQGNSITTLETTVSGHTTQISALEASLSSALSDIEYNSRDINSVNILATSNFESIQLLTTSTTNLIGSTTGLLASAESMIEITDTINNRLFINSFETFSNLDTIANNYTLTLSQTLTSGTYLITGNVTLYVSDITKMVPEDDLITDVNWIASLPILNISVNNNNIIGMQQKIETNRPLETIPINNAVEITNDTNQLIFTINIPYSNNISITVNDIYMYSINLYFVQLH